MDIHIPTWLFWTLLVLAWLALEVFLISRAGNYDFGAAMNVLIVFWAGVAFFAGALLF